MASVEASSTMASLPPVVAEESSKAAEATKKKKKKSPSKDKTPHAYLDQNEGVLRDVLEELDRERSQRAELEARLRKKEQELQAALNNRSLAVPGKGGDTPTQREFLKLQAERDGYLEILNLLTQGRPAFSKQQRLPLHVVRLLEVIPWDPRARQHIFGQETLWEWQILGADKTWQTQLRYFPTVFKTLPIVMPQPGKTVGEAPTTSRPPRQCVLTNIQVTQILNIDKGYPLPQDGGDWKWIGGWRIDKHSEFRQPQKGTPNLVKRRRKWTRSRALIDYPQASAMTKEYLKLISEKASLEVTVDKLSTQLVETKMKLTTIEADQITLQEETNQKVAKLEKELQEKTKVLELLQEQESLDPTNLMASKKDQVQEIRSAVTAWVNSTVAKRPGGKETTGCSSAKSDDNGGSTTATKVVTENTASTAKGSSDSKQLMFESLKGKGTDFFEKIKLKGGEELEKIKKHHKSRSPWS
eukprot:CAMPEP_0176180144 /NCGR_PEP_ID=MMETSP0120_2-20121206/92309_1 /TAXON_ID=160619 /ORGANISM="Kryptoperidinium foliaceum, Strain CCMP 1326" /LENGTH=470 /DNA_ID=CAMNT_0017518351 /DNA_START=148 /DNA_END=1557 /DNA_ORIENTATION=+